jgi:hypothetical protein
MTTRWATLLTFSTATKNCLIPSKVNSSRLTNTLQGPVIPRLTAVKLAVRETNDSPNRVGHEPLGHLQHVMRQSSTQNDNLGSRGKVSVDVVDLILESLVQQLVTVGLFATGRNQSGDAGIHGRSVFTSRREPASVIRKKRAL